MKPEESDEIYFQLEKIAHDHKLKSIKFTFNSKSDTYSMKLDSKTEIVNKRPFPPYEVDKPKKTLPGTSGTIKETTKKKQTKRA